jgi:hypothetical protein
MRVWLVQRIGKPGGGAVADGEGFIDSPDAEILALGFNTGKAYGSVGIGRQGNFLQWGYSAPPSQMTDAGRRLFLNCVYYIHKFDGKTPLIRRRTVARLALAHWGAIINTIQGDQKEFFLSHFPEELYGKYSRDPAGLVKYYRENLEWVYDDQVFKVDEDIKGLGIDSNRKVASLQRLIELLDDVPHATTAKKLLSRYTECSFETPAQWRQWFDQNKTRIYFTDTGGYKFKVIPEGYPPAEAAKR